MNLKEHQLESEQKSHDLRFKHPSTFLLCGSSGSGKTVWTFNLLKNIDILLTDARCKQNIIYFYCQWQPLFDEFSKLNIVTKWINKLPTEEDITELTLPYKDRGGSMIIIDDYAQALTPDIARLFAVLARHCNTTTILLVQNLFTKNPIYREISLNTNFIIVFKNPRDRQQIRNFAQQFAPANSKYVVQAFNEATREPHSYLLFDLHQNTPEYMRLRTNVLPHEGIMSIFFEK
jgi:hypothetical protein